MKIYTEYKKAKIIDFGILQIEETKEVIEVEDLYKFISEDNGKYLVEI